jgi:DNA-directed RNA polymerase subunit beta'
MDHVLDSYANGQLSVKDKIVMLHAEEPITTNVGRVVFNTILPEGLRFINETFGKKLLKQILSLVFDDYGMAETVRVADDIKDL